MTELSTDRPGAVKNKKMPLSQNRFHITADEIQNQNVANEIPGTIMQKHGGKKLPCVCVMNATSTDGKKVANKIRIVALEEQLCDKHRDVRADNCQQRDSMELTRAAFARGLGTAPDSARRVRHRFPPAHLLRCLRAIVSSENTQLRANGSRN